MPSSFDAALNLIDIGDVGGLRRLLADQPGLIHARMPPDAGVPYDGYFKEAGLLHHVAGNPIRGPMPPNAAEVAQALLDAGADVDLETRFGDWSWTTLGLVATSGPAAENGQWRTLIDTLLRAGADPDNRNGIAMYGSAYHVVESRPLREVTRYLADRGAQLDLAFAAAVEDLRQLGAFFDGRLLRSETPRFYRTRPPLDGAVTAQFLLDEALVFASAHGRISAIDFLLERGARMDAFIPFGGESPSAAHVAAWAGWPEAAAHLARAGADLTLRDPKHNCTPFEWAEHCKQPAVADALRPLL